ncbi:MAG: gluconate 2-dehydrogenase subunit 3 family protein [Gemmatimonadota bacterium]
MNRRELVGLLNGLMAGTSLATLVPDELFARGARLDRRGQGKGPFTPHQFETVSEIADLIIPGTDTPGARVAKVPDFIAVIVGEWYRDDEKSVIMGGLAELDVRSQRTFGKDFIETRAEDRVQLLTELDKELQSLKAAKQDTGKNFFHRIKGLTIYGYYTSEIGMTQELHYQVIPGRYDPCIPR